MHPFVFIAYTDQEIIGLCPVCHIKHPLLNSCCFNLCLGLNNPVTGSIWWPVQPQEQIALLDWSQPTVAANKSWLHSDPFSESLRAAFAWVSACSCICVSVCVRAGVYDPKWHVSNKEMKTIVVFFFFSSPTVNHCFYYFTCTSSSHLVCSHAAASSQTSISSIYLLDRSAEWLLLLSRPHKNHSN